MSGHHLVLGKLQDFLTGETLDDTHDERFRQEVARLLVEQKGFAAGEIETRRKLLLKSGEERAVVGIDFLVNPLPFGKTCMIIRYGPGDLVSRQRPALGLSRLVEPYQVPWVVVTNGKDAHVLSGTTGKVVAEGLDAIPSRSELVEGTSEADLARIDPQRAEVESRIVLLYEITGTCECDDNPCGL